MMTPLLLRALPYVGIIGIGWGWLHSHDQRVAAEAIAAVAIADFEAARDSADTLTEAYRLSVADATLLRSALAVAGRELEAGEARHAEALADARAQTDTVLIHVAPEARAVVEVERLSADSTLASCHGRLSVCADSAAALRRLWVQAESVIREQSQTIHHAGDALRALPQGPDWTARIGSGVVGLGAGIVTGLLIRSCPGVDTPS